MNDALLLEMPIEQLAALTRKALDACRVGNMPDLAASPLGASSLVVTCFLAGKTDVSSREHGRAVLAVLRWAVEQIRPEGAHNWTAYNWRSYNLLHFFYLQGMRVADLAEKMAIVEQTFYDARPAALSAVTQVLRQELINPQDIPGRKKAYLEGVYTALTPQEQLPLRMTAIFRRPIPLAWLEKLLEDDLRKVGKPRQANEISQRGGLLTSSFLISNEDHTLVQVHPEARPYLLSLATSIERQGWHTTAAACYQDQRDYLETAFHLRRAGYCKPAAEVILDHVREIADNFQTEDLRERLAEFRPAELPKTLWMKLKLVAGDLAEKMQDLDSAIEEYRSALAAEDVDIRAEANYRLAKALRLQHVDEALAYHRQCIQLLEESGTQKMLLARAYIGEAWIFFDQRPDLTRAEANLARAESLIERTHRDLWAELHNAWGELAYHRGDLNSAIDHHLQSWMASVEIQHREFMLRASHNLGRIYIERGQTQEGLTYLQKCLSLAGQMGDRRMEGVCRDAMGAGYFELRDYAMAAQQYQLAHQVFIEMGNRDWLAANCYNLAEAYAAMNDFAQARAYFQEGLGIAQEMGLTRYLRSFDALASRYPGLAVETRLDSRQIQVFEYICAHGLVKSTDCANALGFSKDQAIDILNTLIEKGLIQRQGKAGGTRYGVI